LPEREQARGRTAALLAKHNAGGLVLTCTMAGELFAPFRSPELEGADYAVVPTDRHREVEGLVAIRC
jgi:hypothetical protein